MKKIFKTFLVLFLFSIIFTSCAQPKTFVINKEKVIVEPYGWVNSDLKNDSIIYVASAGNVAWSIIVVETVVIPVYLTGWQLFQPIKKKK